MAEIEVGRYQFHSWSRKGIASKIEEDDDLGEGGSGITERVQVTIPVTLNEAELPTNFALIGPGDIIGLNRDMIVRTEPLNRITNFEPNYLAFVEFYDEDFAWRYTPARPVFPDVAPAALYKPSKLRPWVFLLILKEEEFEKTKRRTPVPSITIKTNNAFPPADETWLWAHVHSNADLEEMTDQAEFLALLNTTIDDDPDQLYCRLVSPRKLEPNFAYTAFIVPAFETGRLAGLEKPTAGINSQLPSWGDNTEGLEMPVYYEWSFSTGINADFESLVRALQPVKMDAKVGIRDMDCHNPGFVRAYSDEEFPGTSPSVIGLEGALKSPDTVSTIFPDPADTGEFPEALEELINLPVGIKGTNDSGDPVISIPLYGGKHAKKAIDDIVMFDFNKTSWLHDLNKDPRTRVAAGLGTLVVQKNQEKYMANAWEQVMTIIRANRMILLTQFHMNVALAFTRKTFSKLPETILLSMSRPVLSRVMGSPTTVYHQIKESRLPAAVFSGAFRRMVSPRKMKKIDPASDFNITQLVSQLNEGKLSAAASKAIPAGIPNTKAFADKVFPYEQSSLLKWIIKNRKWLLIGLLVLFAGLAILTGAFIIMGALAAASAGGYVYVNRLGNDQAVSQTLLDPEKELESIAAIPQRPNFTLKLSDEKTTPPPTITSSSTDSVEARKFRVALTQLVKRATVKAPEKEIASLDTVNVYRKVSDAIHPAKAFTKRLSATVLFPGNSGIEIKEPEKVFPAMAYPDFEDPMYQKLTEISSELLLPNLELIPNNCISLLKTNPKFIESYLVGLNHEMGRELLWREYPTDERGSYFRQFWDVKGIVSPSSNTATAQAKDIKAIDTWATDSELGQHNNRSTSGNSPEKLVLVIRGDLLKQYPGAVIFCQKAIAGTNPNEPVIIHALSDDDFKVHVKFPLFKAEISPDLKFFGFDMTIEQARGTALSENFDDNLGWFFCIAQPPGEARFGMDITYNPGEGEISWDDLSWNNYTDPVSFITTTVVPDVPDLNAQEKSRWGTDAATMADILFQKPGMVAVHAKQMLANLTN